MVISHCLWPGGRARACAKPNPQLRWFVMILLTLKPLAPRGKVEAELAVGEICLQPQLHPNNLRVYFHLSFPIPGQGMRCLL